MGKYVVTIDTDSSPDREAGLQKVVEDYNISIEIPPDSELPPETSTPLTVTQYLQREFDRVIDSYAKAYLDGRSNVLAVKFSKADPTLRTSVEDLLSAIPAKSVEPEPVKLTSVTLTSK